MQFQLVSEGFSGVVFTTRGAQAQQQGEAPLTLKLLMTSE